MAGSGTSVGLEATGYHLKSLPTDNCGITGRGHMERTAEEGGRED